MGDDSCSLDYVCILHLKGKKCAGCAGEPGTSQHSGVKADLLTGPRKTKLKFGY